MLIENGTAFGFQFLKEFMVKSREGRGLSGFGLGELKSNGHDI